jgi:uncharacterized phage-associated protein
MPYDARAIANLIIAYADERKIAISHLALQKILYFTHGKFLLESGEPLVSGTFEAWPYGPVHPLIYSSFKEHGSILNCKRAVRKDLISGKVSEVSDSIPKSVEDFISQTVPNYLRMRPAALVELSHAPGTPWDVLTKTAQKRSYGHRISEGLIRERFRYHKVTMSESQIDGDLDEVPPNS